MDPSGDAHLTVFWDDALAVAIPNWKNAMGATSRCVAFIDGAHGKKSHESPEGNPVTPTRRFVMMSRHDSS